MAGIDSQSMNITARLAANQEEEEKDQGSSKDIRMMGVEYASIQPGDLSPGVMNINSSEDRKSEAAASSTDSNEATSTATQDGENT